MAMTTCRECQGNVSSEADVCPHCGIKDPAKSKMLAKLIGGWILLIGIVVGVYFLWTPVIQPLSAVVTLLVLGLLSWILAGL